MSRINDLIKELCPNGVVFKRIGEIANYRRGSFPQPYTNESYYGGEDAMPFVQVADVKDNFRLVDSTKNTISKIAQPLSVFVPKGTVIVTLQGTIGRVAITQYDAYVDRTLAIFEGLSSELNTKYFVYQLKSKFDYEKQFARGSTIKTITKEEMTEFKIPIPPLEVQKEIVRILDKFGELETELETELEARKSQYEFWRGDLFKQDIDKMVTLENIGDVTKLAGFEFSEYVNYSDEGNIIALRGLNVKNGHLILNDVKYVDNSDFSKLNRSKLYENDILYTYVGTVGQVGLVDKNDKYYLAPNVARIRILDEKVNPKYVMHFLLTNEFKANQLDPLSGTSSMKNITMTNIRKFKIPVPSLDKQNRIVDILDKFDSLVNDISVGLPAEIELRRKQYEYYRNILLSFEELSVSE